MSEFALQHPWMTFVLAILLIATAYDVGLAFAKAFAKRRGK